MYITYEVIVQNDRQWGVYLHEECLGIIKKNEHGFYQVISDEQKYLWPSFDLAVFWTIRCASVVLATAAYRRQSGKDDTDLMEIGEF
jgi:hypothetical protein